MGRLWNGDGACIRLRPERRDHEWVYDFVAARTVDGRKFRMLDMQLVRATRIYKHDPATGKRRVHEFGAGQVPEEFVFVPAGFEAGEDEGWRVIDAANDTTDCTVIDARAFEAAPIATVHLGHRIPAGVHGNWVFARPGSNGRPYSLTPSR